MKKNLITKLSVALALTGVIGGVYTVSSQSQTAIVHASPGEEFNGFTQYIDDEDIPTQANTTKEQLFHINFIGFKKQSRADSRQYTRLNKKLTHIGKYRVSQEAKKYYNDSDTKFKRPVKLTGAYSIDKVHKNEVAAMDTNYTLNGDYADIGTMNVDAFEETPYALGYKKIDNIYYELVVWYNPKRKMYVSPSFSEIDAYTNTYRVLRATNYLGASDDPYSDQEPTYGIGKGTKVVINNDFAHSNWRTRHNNQVLGNKVYGSHGFGFISAINFNKYFKKIK